MVDVEQGQRRPSTPFLRLLGPPPTPKTPPSDSRDPQTSPFERRQTPPARREPLNQAILTSLQRSRTQIDFSAEVAAYREGGLKCTKPGRRRSGVPRAAGWG
jgi:hypothetical protein